MLSTQNRSSTSAPGDGSRTITVHDVPLVPESLEGDSVDPSVLDGTLRLRGGPRSRPRVAWDERVVDNEDCGKKKSKICCIYHKPKGFDESSDEESSSDSESDLDDGRARPRHPHRHHLHQYPANAPNGNTGGRRSLQRADDNTVVHEVEAARESNAYEAQLPHAKKGKGRVDS